MIFIFFCFWPKIEKPIIGSLSFPIIVWPPIRGQSIVLKISFAPNNTCSKSLELISVLDKGNCKIIIADVIFELTDTISLMEWFAAILPNRKGSVMIELIISTV